MRADTRKALLRLGTAPPLLVLAKTWAKASGHETASLTITGGGGLQVGDMVTFPLRNRGKKQEAETPYRVVSVNSSTVTIR